MDGEIREALCQEYIGLIQQELAHLDADADPGSAEAIKEIRGAFFGLLKPLAASNASCFAKLSGRHLDDVLSEAFFTLFGCILEVKVGVEFTNFSGYVSASIRNQLLNLAMRDRHAGTLRIYDGMEPTRPDDAMLRLVDADELDFAEEVVGEMGRDARRLFRLVRSGERQCHAAESLGKSKAWASATMSRSIRVLKVRLAAV